MDNSSKLLNIKELANFLGLSESSIRWHLRHKRLNCIRLGRRILFNPAVIIRDLQKLERRF